MTTATNKIIFNLKDIKQNITDISLASFTYQSKVYPIDSDLIIKDIKPTKPEYTYYNDKINFIFAHIISPIENHLAELFDISEADLIYKRHFMLDFEKLTVQDNNIYIHYSRPDIKILLDTDLDIHTASHNIAKALYENVMIQLSDDEIRVIKNTRSFIG